MKSGSPLRSLIDSGEFCLESSHSFWDVFLELDPDFDLDRSCFGLHISLANICEVSCGCTGNMCMLYDA